MKLLLISLLLVLPSFSSQAQPRQVNKNAKAFREEGYRLQQEGDLQSALAFYQKASQTDPQFAQVYNDIGVIYESQGAYEEASVMYETALEIDPKCLSAYSNLALLYEKQGEKRKAAAYWKKRYELGEKGDHWWEFSRQRLFALGVYPEARREILQHKAAILSKDFINKRQEDSKKLLKEAKEHFNAGDRAHKEGDYKKATEEYRAIISLNPPNENLKKQVRISYRRSERLYLKEKALIDVQKAIDLIKSSDYFAAGEKLESALETVFDISQQK